MPYGIRRTSENNKPSRTIGIFEAKNGLLIGAPLSPACLLQLLHESRRAA